jgi:hypothetical protein
MTGRPMKTDDLVAGESKESWKSQGVMVSSGGLGAKGRVRITAVQVGAHTSSASRKAPESPTSSTTTGLDNQALPTNLGSVEPKLARDAKPTLSGTLAQHNTPSNARRAQRPTHPRRTAPIEIVAT